MKKLLIALILFLWTASTPFAAQWPPVLEKSEDFNERLTDRFIHGSLPEWGAKNPDQTDEFAVVHPKIAELVNAPDRPLYVVLHSAGHALDSCLNCTLQKGNHDIYDTPDDFYGLFLDCRANRETDWWWGGLEDDEVVTDENRDKSGGELSPVEKRVIATVLWTIDHYKLDPNRVYLCGNSMGGSGTLGIGLRHGDVFAAIKANVPAGCRHAAERMFFPPSEIPPGVTLPDPPICVDYSGSNDKWSRDHAVLFRGMKERAYPLLAFWGPFGHVNNNEKLEEVNDLVHRFDWTAVRKDLAYPVFIDATTDSPIPWPDPVDEFPKSAPAGQVNAFFRWENLSDAPDKMEMLLSLVGKEELHSKIFDAPTEATADISFRRLRDFRVAPGERIGWTFGGRRGTVTADENGLVTIPRLRVTTEPTTMTLVKNPVWPGAAVDAADYGFLPTASGAENAAALQRGLDGGNKTVTITKPGDYLLDKTVYLESGTRLICSDGVVLKKEKPYVHVLLNRGALSGQWDENIEIDGLQIAVNEKSAGLGPDDPLFGLRGQLAFYRVRNLEIRDFRCLDVFAGQYAVQICVFENLVIDGFEIRGEKDGIHIGAGRGFYVANGVCETFDDALALNAQDYASSQPQQGDILDGLVENLTDLQLDPTSGHAVRLLTGAWVDWRPGMKFQNGDTLRHNGNVYRVVATFDTAQYVSNHPPIHEKGEWTDPDVPELKFVFNEKSDALSANIRNVTFRDIQSFSRTGFGTYWEFGSYHRSVHPEVAEENLPVCEVTIENFVSQTPHRNPLMSGNSNVTVWMDDAASNGPIFQFIGSERPIRVDFALRNSEFRPDGRGDSVPDIAVAGKAAGSVSLAGNRLGREIRLSIDDECEIDVSGSTRP